MFILPILDKNVIADAEADETITQHLSYCAVYVMFIMPENVWDNLNMLGKFCIAPTSSSPLPLRPCRRRCHNAFHVHKWE